MSEPNEGQYRSVLSSLGLSQESIDYISTRRDPAFATKIYWLGIILYAGLFIGLMVGALFLSRHFFFENMMEQRTRGSSVLFYDSLWYTHSFFVLMLAITLPGYIVYVLLDLFPGAAELVALKSIDDTVRRNSPQAFHGTVTAVAGAAAGKLFIDDTFRRLPIREALRYYNQKSARWAKRGSLVMIIFLIPLMILDATNYTMITPEGVRAVPYGSFQPLSESWKDVSRIETGCFIPGGRNSQPRLQYDIFFNDGFNVDIFNPKNIFAAKDPGQPLERLRKIDAIVTKTGKPFQLGKVSGGIHAGEPFLSAGCRDAMEKQYPGDYTQIITLLRLEKYLPPH